MLKIILNVFLYVPLITGPWGYVSFYFPEGMHPQAWSGPKGGEAGLHLIAFHLLFFARIAQFCP
jgi:hypothetical protein